MRLIAKFYLKKKFYTTFRGFFFLENVEHHYDSRKVQNRVKHQFKFEFYFEFCTLIFFYNFKTILCNNPAFK